MWVITIFILGYLLITLEHSVGLNKAATALVTGVLCWVVYLFSGADIHLVNEQLMEQIGETAGILFFLLGAMTVVELIDAHDGFHLVTRAIKTNNKRKVLWIVAVLTFFLSAVLDNLTTTILMVSIMRKIIGDKEERWFFLGIIIICSNAGGAWSPIGDVTTTMLWIGGQITTASIVTSVFAPSLVCMIVPVSIASIRLKGNLVRPADDTGFETSVSAFQRNAIFFSGIGILLLIPVFKTLTHLPPFMGMLLGLGLLWVISEVLNKSKDTEEKDALSVVYALRKIDTPSILFFLGILVAIGALQAAGILQQAAGQIDKHISSPHYVAMLIGLFSAIVDNVPLVAASMGMYDLAQFPTDHTFWRFLAYTTGTGGSALIIGSAAGVAVMGMEHMNFFWYLKRISWLALCGFFAGAFVYMAMNPG